MDGFERRAWSRPRLLSEVVDSKTMERLGVLGDGYGRVRLEQHDADDVMEEAWRYLHETTEYLKELDLDVQLDPTSIAANIIESRHALRTRP